MDLRQKFEKHVRPKLKSLMDSEAISKDKCYKLGEWLHGEYRDKLSRTERVNKLTHFKTKVRTINAKNSTEA
jgi:hypothetical protein